MDLKIGDWVEFTAEPYAGFYITKGKIEEIIDIHQRVEYWIREYATKYAYRRNENEIRKLTDEEIMIILLEGENVGYER